MKKIIIVSLFFALIGCTQSSTKPTPLPKDDFLVIAHRGASAYAPDHTLHAYDMATQMGADYIELDLQMTKDGKLVALHDRVISLREVEQAVADVTLDELQLYSPGEEFNEENPHYASASYEKIRVVELKEILLYFGDKVNYYIEIKSPDSSSDVEKELLRQLQEHGLLHRNDERPKVIIQSFNTDSLQKVFDLAPSIPLIKLYSFDKDAYLSKKELQKLKKYASGVGVNADKVTKKFVESLHKENLAIHPFTVNDEATIRTLMTLGVDGVFTDKPDIAVQTKKSSMDTQ